MARVCDVCLRVSVRYVKEWMKRMYCFLSFWFSIRLNTIPSVEWHSFFLVRTTIVVYVCVCMSVRIWIFELCWQWNYFEQRERQREMFRQVSNISFCECVYLWMCVCTYKYICISIRPMHIFWICLRSPHTYSIYTMQTDRTQSIYWTKCQFWYWSCCWCYCK